ncbi:mycothione reductase [Rhodococcus sp. HNM0569]|uniref:mycothione reductase n=1 Tax=Rhodococcus sp. HNM0569 TaxID=2716340 RepID=UPI00146B6347|nr:mycothione reductase [Rhodococcus sp. HNM0569]
MRHFDVAVIGSGSGNLLVDSRFRDRRVALLEEGTFGGTCLNVGCIPTKMFVHTADLARAVERASVFGIDAADPAVRWNDVVARVFGRVDPLSESGERARAERSPHVTLFRGHAEFVGERMLDTGTGERISADQVVVAAGSRPVIPEVVTDAGVPFETSATIMRLTQLPERLVILGGGTIAAEFAHVFSSFGVHVTVLARGPMLLRRADDEIAQRFTTHARTLWDVRTDAHVESVRGEAGAVELVLADGAVVRGDCLLVATGRQANGDRIGAAAGGVEIRDDGRVVVDEWQRTSAPGVWALGDVSSPHQLKHVSNHEARVVARNILGGSWTDTSTLDRSDHRFVPAAVFTDPQIATVGLTERDARGAGYDVAVGRRDYSGVAFGWALEDTTGFCKVVVDRASGALLGGHILGAEASTLVQPLVQALTFGQSAAEVARGQYWIHPALTEVVENALLEAADS